MIGWRGVLLTYCWKWSRLGLAWSQYWWRSLWSRGGRPQEAVCCKHHSGCRKDWSSGTRFVYFHAPCCYYYLYNISQSSNDLHWDGEEWNINKNVSVGKHKFTNISWENKTLMTLLVDGEYLDQNCVQNVTTYKLCSI